MASHEQNKGHRTHHENGSGTVPALCYGSSMSRFNELLGALRDPGEEPVPETIYDDLSTEFGMLSESSAAKVAEMEEKLLAKESEISRLKSMNYDLLVSAPTGEVEPDEPDDEPDDEAGIDSLFESEND